MSENDEIEPETQVVLFIIISFIVGFISMEINKRTSIHYTPLLIAFGILLRGSDIFFNQFGQVERIHPHAILIIFHPILIFESAFNTHIEVVNKNKLQVFYLAIPGVIMTLFMLSFVLKIILGYDENDMTWTQSYLLGTILATTDPVAVVALLKEVGAPLHIETLLEMESLFNDGISLLFLALFSGAAAGEGITVSEVVKDFFSIIFGGLALGVAFYIACKIILKIFKKRMREFINIIIITAFSLYVVCEKLTKKTSGLFALVVLGLNLNKALKDQMDKVSKQSLSTIQYFLETILFFLCGDFIGSIFFNASNTEIDSSDWLKMFLLYLFVLLSRIIMFAVLYYPLSKTGDGFNLKKSIIMSWGGLRGSLSIILGLIVHEDTKLSQRTRDLVLFHSTGITFFSLMINGTFSGFLIRILKLKDTQDEKMRFKSQILKEIRSFGKQMVDQLKYEESYKFVEWKGTEKLIEIQSLDNQIKKLELTIEDKTIKQMQISGYESKMIYYTRYQVLRLISKKVKDNKNKSWISSDIYDRVFDSIEISLEQCQKQINLWDYLEQQTTSLEKLVNIQKYEKIPIIGKLVSMYIHFRLELTYEMAYIIQQSIQQTIEQMHDGNQQSYQIKSLPHVKALLIIELQQNLKQVKDVIEEVSFKFWNVVGKLQQRKAAQTVLMNQVNKLDEYIESTYLPEKEGIDTKYQIVEQIQKLSTFYSFFKLSTIEDQLIRSAFKNYFSECEFRDLMENSEECVFKKDQYLAQKGKEQEYIYIITHGKVEVILYPIEVNPNVTYSVSDIQSSFVENSVILNRMPSVDYGNKEKREEIFEDFQQIAQENQKDKIHVGIGSMTGVVNLIADSKESLVDIKSLTITSCMKVKIQFIKTIFEQNEKFQEYCYKRTLFQFLHMYPSKYGSKLIKLGDDLFSKLVSQSEFIYLTGKSENQKAEIISSKYGGFIFKGKLQSADQKYQFDQWQTIPKIQILLVPLEETKFILFKPKTKMIKKCIEEKNNIEDLAQIAQHINIQKTNDEDKLSYSACLNNVGERDSFNLENKNIDFQKYQRRNTFLMNKFGLTQDDQSERTQ